MQLNVSVRKAPCDRAKSANNKTANNYKKVQRKQWRTGSREETERGKVVG